MRAERRRAALASIAAAVLLAGCASAPVPGGGDAPPLVSRPGLENQPDPVPRWEPPRSAGNRSPYMVFGRTYHVMDTAVGYEETGLASWYGRKFHGRNTSNGERYDMFALTAAHKHLPLPTWLRVTNLANGRSTIVRVNDRGPFHGDRIIDLSYGAAVKLGFADAGVTRVRLEAIVPPRPGSAPTTAEAAPPEAAPGPEATAAVASASDGPTADLEAGTGRIWLQAGAFGDAGSAAELRDALTALLDAREEPVAVRLDAGDDALTRVRIGPLADLAEANRLQALITFADIAGVPLIVRE